MGTGNRRIQSASRAAIKPKANEVLRRLFVKQVADLNEVKAFRSGGMSLFVVICCGNLQKEIPMLARLLCRTLSVDVSLAGAKHGLVCHRLRH